MSSAISFTDVPGGRFLQTTVVEIARLFFSTASLIDEATVIRKDEALIQATAKTRKIYQNLPMMALV